VDRRKGEIGDTNRHRRLLPPSFSRRSYLTVGARLADFPMALDGILRDGGSSSLSRGPFRGSWF